MKTAAAASVLFVTTMFGGAAFAQVDPGYQPPAYPPQPYGQPAYGQYPQTPPPDQQQQQYDPNQQQQYDPNQQPYDPYAQQQGDNDPDIDGYDATTDVYYDNLAAQGYDDGYDPNAYQQFDSALQPYGTWYDDPTYGHVWAPSASAVGYDFSPYSTGGHWVLTEYGWTWVSDWDWGWGPFHYGRWETIGSYGWCWIPGTVWGPAWVSWRSGGGYVGWSPLPPAGVVVGPPRGVRSPWRFTVASQLGTAHPSFLPAHVVPSVFARTSVINNAHSVAIGNASVRVNAGPTGTFVGAGVGVSTPVRLASIAPRAVPHETIAPRLGTALNARPWVQARVANLDPRVMRAVGGPAPMNNAGRSFGPRPMQPAQQRTAPPRYLPPAQSHSVYSPQQPHPYAPSTAQRYYAPSYTPPGQHNSYAPSTSYQAPSSYGSSYSPHYYSAPATSYQAPSYSAPHYSAPAAPHYSAPAYSAPAATQTHTYSAPHYSAPAAASHSFSGGGHGGHR